MDMNKAFYLHKEDRNPQWRLIDANGVILGRLATQVANALRGKDKPFYTPHDDAGDYVVVINADKVKLSGDKWEGKEYARYTGWIGGYKVTKAKDLLLKHPTQLIELAVRGMLPKNKLNREVIKKLKVYAGPEHPHQAQVETSKRNQSEFVRPVRKVVKSNDVKAKKAVVAKKATQKAAPKKSGKTTVSKSRKPKKS
jgi:large subunit ribosomal protein L13